MLTQKQLKLLKFIDDYMRQANVSPSFDEMKAGIGIRSKSGIHALIKSLEERGCIRKLPNKARALEIIRRPHELSFLAVKESAVSAEWAPTKAYQIPFYGIIGSLLSIEAFRPTHQSIEITPHLFPTHIKIQNLFALRLSGDSMKEAAILNGDLLIIDESEKPHNGDIVLALVNQKEITLRRWSEEGDKIFLTAANKYFMPQVYDKTQIKVKGKMIKLLRDY